MNTIDSINEKINTAKELDFGSIFSEAIELFKKTWVQGLVMLLLTMVLFIPFYILMYLPLIAMGLFDPEVFQQGQDPNIAILIPFYIFMLIFSFFASIIGFGMKAGLFRIFRNKDYNLNESDDYFYFFKKPYFGKTFKVAAASFGISILAMMLCFLPIIYAIVPMAIMNVLYAFNPDMSTNDIVKASFSLGNKKWLLVFGLLFISGMLAGIVGFMMCVVGIYVTASFSYIPLYIIYKRVIGFVDNDEIKEIGQNIE